MNEEVDSKMKFLSKIWHHKSKGIGLLGVWASAAFAIIGLYVVISFVLPMVGMIDFEVYQLLNNPAFSISASWVTLYQTCVGYLRQSFSYLLFGCLIGLIAWVVIAPLRREPNEYYEDQW
jgi:uncharacterized protein YqgC (DUF456 family)